LSVTDELLSNNGEYAAAFDKRDSPLQPGKGVAIVVACMDARLNVYGSWTCKKATRTSQGTQAAR